MSDTTPRILYDPGRQAAMFSGPGGFTECPMPERSASAIACALGLPFKVAVPGVDVRRSAHHPDSFMHDL